MVVSTSWMEQAKTNTRRVYLSHLSTILTASHNQRRSQESRIMPKVKLALLSLGYHVPAGPINDLSVNTYSKRRCYLCPAKPGRKVRQICNKCGENVCLSHSNSITIVTCRTCEKKNWIKEKLGTPQKISNIKELIILSEYL